jgi:hypothetical protein
VAPAPETADSGRPPIDALQRRIHRSMLAAILVSGAVAATSGFADTEPPPREVTTFVAVALGLVCVVMRRLSTSPMVGPRAEVALDAAGLATGALLALLGAWIAIDQDAGRTGLAYAAAAFILCVRPPIPSHLRVRRRKLDPD